MQPNKERGGWDVVKELHRRASVHTSTKQEAVSRAREIVKHLGGGEVRIKNEQGRMIDSDTVKPSSGLRGRNRKGSTTADGREQASEINKGGRDEA